MADSKLTTFYDRISDKYDLVMNLTGYTILSRLVFKKLPNRYTSPRILDLGCGTGITTRLIEEKFLNARITALDNSENMLNIYRKKFPENEVMLGDFNGENGFYAYPGMKRAPLPPGAFDIVVSVGAVLEYGIPDKVFSFIYDVLKTSGMAVIIGAKKSFFTDIAGTICWKYKLPDTREILSTIGQSGFRHISCNGSGNRFPANFFKEIIIAYK